MKRGVLIGFAVGLALAASAPLPRHGAGDRTRSRPWQELRVPAPAMTFRRLHGSEVALSALRGKVVVLDYWTTWCDPCIDEVPELAAFHEWTQTRTDVVFLSVNDDGDAGALARFLAWKKPRFPVVLPGREDPLAIDGYPTKVVIDPHGWVRFRLSGGPVPADEIRRRALQALGSPPADARPR
jgi:thiol-disulfide isomerase/thioredoxin